MIYAQELCGSTDWWCTVSHNRGGPPYTDLGPCSTALENAIFSAGFPFRLLAA